MSNHSHHRGPHPQDLELFGVSQHRALQEATSDLSWLLTRQYSPPSAIKLVGDRHCLTARQRTAVGRSACSDGERASRLERRVSLEQIAGEELWIDGFNVLTTLEAALSEGVILHAQDGCYRDMASMHGTYRGVQETVPAIELCGWFLAEWKPSKVNWLLDQPVSNSGRLKSTMLDAARSKGWNWEVELVADPDMVLVEARHIVASADSQILNGAARWLNLARLLIDAVISSAWIVHMSP